MDLTLNLFDNEIARANREIDELQQQAERLAEQLARTRAELARQEAHRRTLEAHRAILIGEHAPLTPQQISSDEDVLGLRVGALLLSPPEDATVADLRLHAATMRQLYQQAIHQARLAEDAINDMDTPADEPDEALDDELTASAVNDSPVEAALTEPPPRYADLIGRPVIVSCLDGRDAGVLVDATADVLRLDDDGTIREISTFLVRTVTLDGLRALDDTPDPTATRPDDPAPATGANEEAD